MWRPAFWMSVVRDAFRAGPGGGPTGGIPGYPLEQLHEEVAFIAYYFHWPLSDILELQHSDRRGWVEEISNINRRLHDDAGRSVAGLGSGPWSSFSG